MHPHKRCRIFIFCCHSECLIPLGFVKKWGFIPLGFIGKWGFIPLGFIKKKQPCFTTELHRIEKFMYTKINTPQRYALFTDYEIKKGEMFWKRRDLVSLPSLMTAKQLYSELTTWDAQSMLVNTIIANVPFEEYVEELIKFKFRNETLSEDLIKRTVKNFVEKVKRRE